jgi:hypothetical protein
MLIVSSRRVVATVFAIVLGATACGGRRDTAIDEATLYGDGRTLALAIFSCNADPEVRVEEGSDSVRLLARSKRGNDGDCMDAARVELRAPLGERRLIDDHDDDEIPIRRVEDLPRPTP